MNVINIGTSVRTSYKFHFVQFLQRERLWGSGKVTVSNITAENGVQSGLRIFLGAPAYTKLEREKTHQERRRKKSRD